MDLDPVRETDWLANLPPIQRTRFLASLSHKLTIAIRVLVHSEVSATQALEWVRTLNEAHHRVAGYLQQVHEGNERESWLQDVVNRVLAETDPTVCHQASQAWHAARSGVQGSA